MPFFKSTKIWKTATVTEPTQHYIALGFCWLFLSSNEIKFGLLTTEVNQDKQPHKSSIQLGRAAKNPQEPEFSLLMKYTHAIHSSSQ